MKARTLNRALPNLDDLGHYEARIAKAWQGVLEFAARRAVERFERFASGTALVAAPGVGSRTAMVAVYPTAEQQAMLARPGGEDADVIHCTLAFLGDLTVDQADAALAAIRTVAENSSTLSGEVGGVAHFADNGDGYPSIVLPDVDGLAELRYRVVAALEDAGIDVARNHGWTPHLTLSYEETPGTPHHSLLGLPLTFETLSVAVGDVRRDLDLGGALVAGGAVVAESETGKLVGEVAAKYGPDSAPDYGDCYWNAETGTVYWITADYTSNEALENAPTDFLAIDGVESVEDCDECGPPEGDGWEFVYDNAGVASVVAAGPPSWHQPQPDELVNVDQLIERGRNKTNDVRNAVIATVAKPALEKAGIDFDLTNPLIAGVYGQVGQQITYIAETTRLNAMRIVRRAYEEGLSIPDTASALQEGMMAASAARATLIARTEMTSLVNGASLASAQIIDQSLSQARDEGEPDAQDFAGYHKRWLTAPGAHWPRHEDYDGLDGQTVPLDAPFDVGGAQLMYPGDPAGPPEEVCNCRCTIVLVDASGEAADVEPGDLGLEAAATPPLPFDDDREGGTDVKPPAKKTKTTEEALVAGASGKTGLPLTDRNTAWDVQAATDSLQPAQYGDASFWTDPDGDPETLTAHKLFFAKNDGGLTAVWRGVTACAAVIQGSRGGVDIPSGDVAGVKAKIESYYADARKKYDDDSIEAPWKASGDAAIQFAEDRGLDVLYAEGADGEDVYAGVGGDFNPVELVEVQQRAAATALAYADLGTVEGDDFEQRRDDYLTTWQKVEELAPADEPMQGECANCGHDATDHAGEMNDGACDVDGCDCSGFAMTEGDRQQGDPGETTAAHDGMTAFVRIRPELDPTFHSTIAEGVAHAVNEGLSRLAFSTTVVTPNGDTTLVSENGDALAVVDERPPAQADEIEIVPAENGIGESGTMQPWRAVLAPEGKVTDDGRLFAPGSISWRELPLSLAAMTETPGEGGHAGAEVAGRIDRIWRDEATLPIWIMGEGVFDDGDWGTEVARLVDEQTLRGNSVDLAIRRVEFGPRDLFVDENGLWRDDAPAEGEVPEPTADDLFSGDLIMVVRDAVIGMSTVCPFPAFEDANIVLASGEVGDFAWSIEAKDGQPVWRVWVRDGIDSGEVLTASGEGMAPTKPPAEWFADPELDELTPLTVDDEGRVYGHAWAWDACHIGIPGTCVTAPRSETDYAYFHLKEVECEDGQRVAVGTITLGTGHANERASRQAATEHYDHTGTAVADVRIYEDDFGGAVAGALRPDVPAGRVREFRGSTPSGDWRKVNGNLELVGLLAVNVPGFPVPRTKALVASVEDGEPDVLSLVAAGIPTVPAGTGEIEYLEPAERAKLAALAARAGGGLAGLAALARSRPVRHVAPTLVAAPVWDSETGLMDVMADISAALNPGDSYEWYVVDVAIGGESAIIANFGDNEYFLVPLTYADGDPVVPPATEWTEVESEWVAAAASAGPGACARGGRRPRPARVA